MKAQAWVTDINTQNPVASSTGYIASTQPRLVTPMHIDDAQLAQPALYLVDGPAVPSSGANPKAQALTMASVQPSTMSSDDTVVERTVVKTVWNPPPTSTAVILATPMKRVDSISASAGHLKTSALSAHASGIGTLRYAGSSGDVIRDNVYQYTRQVDRDFDLFPAVQSIREHLGTESDASKLHMTSETSFRNMQQQQSADVVSLPSAASENSANVSAALPSESVISALTVRSHSSVAEHAVSPPVTLNASSQTSADGLLPSQKNTRLNELWHRFSQDHTVCSPHATDSGTAVGVGCTESHITDSNVQPSTYHHLQRSNVKHVAGDKSEDIMNAEKLQQQSLSDILVSNNSHTHSLSSGAFVSNVHKLSSDCETILQNNMEPSHSSYDAHVNTENRTKFRLPSESGDAGRVSSSASVPIRHGWIVKDETLAVVPEDTTLDSVTSDFVSTSSVDERGNIITCTTKRHLPNDSKLLRLQQKIAQQREKHRKVCRNEQHRKEHIVKMELALHERQKAIEQGPCDMKKTKEDSQLHMTATSSTTLTTVTSNDSDLTLCSSSLQSDDHHLIGNSQLLSAFDRSGSCLCHQTQSRMDRVVNPKAEDVFVQKRQKSETTFKPTLREVKYAKSKATKSAPSLLSHQTASREQMTTALPKNAKRKVVSSSSSRGIQVPETARVKKNAQDDRRSFSKMSKPIAKANSVSHIVAKKYNYFSADHGRQSKAVQTTPHLKDNRVRYASTAVQCSAVPSHFDELGVISVPVVSRSQYVKTSSSSLVSPDSSSDAELLQHLKYLIKQPARASVPCELLAVGGETNNYHVCILTENYVWPIYTVSGKKVNNRQY